jgi:hypothetical protein
VVFGLYFTITRTQSASRVRERHKEELTCLLATAAAGLGVVGHFRVDLDDLEMEFGFLSDSFVWW